MRYDNWQTMREKAEVLPCGLKVLREDNYKPCVSIWMPKAFKPFANYSFKTSEDRERYIEQAIKNYEAGQATKAKWKADRKGSPEMMDQIKIGAIFHCSWGYDQTNNDYYQVIEKKGRYVVIREIGSHQSLDNPGNYAHGMANHVVAAPNHFTGEPMTKLVQFSGGKPYLTMTSYSSASLWDGKHNYESWYA